MTKTKLELLTNVALGLSAQLFSGGCTIGDARLITQGRFSTWPGWQAVSSADRERVTRFLYHRAEDVTDDQCFLEEAMARLATGDDFHAVGDRVGWDMSFEATAGRALVEKLDAWLSELDGRRIGRARRAIERSGDVAELLGDRLGYRVPIAHLPETSPPLRVTTSPPQAALRIDVAALRQLARSIDGRLDGRGPRYEEVAVDGFLDRLKLRSGQEVTSIPSGRTQLVVAPTGCGKSVFARLLALDLARDGVPVALVVPDVQTAWKETEQLRLAAGAAGLDGLKISPLSSARRLGKRVVEFLQDDEAGHGSSFVLSEMTYSCSLSAYASTGDDPPKFDEEPCTRLRQIGDGKGAHEVSVACPFSAQCGRFAMFERAVSADILIVNHHAPLAGRVPLPVSVDGQEARKISTAELVLRRCGVLLIDEIDSLQATTISANSRSLALSGRRNKLGAPLDLIQEVENRRSQRESAPSFEDSRDAATEVYRAAESLAEAINNNVLSWEARGHMTWCEAHDADLADVLFPEHDERLPLLRALYDDAAHQLPHAEALRTALRPLASGIGGQTRISPARVRVMAALGTFLVGPSPAHAQRLRARATDRLIQRAMLLRIDQGIQQLRPQLPKLEEQGVRAASQMRDELLGYAHWQPSPMGALGQRVFGYGFSDRADEHGAIETQVVGGDPHGFLAELGGLVAETLSGRTRVVLGLSATCRFDGSPRSDVVAPVIASVEDDARNVVVAERAVSVRISGLREDDVRMAAAADATRELWDVALRPHLESLMADDEARDRGRVLVVTSRYDEALAAGRALREVASRDVRVQFLVRGSREASNEPGAMTRRQLEAFGRAPAPAILVAPLGVVARGHNILQAQSQRSAISSIFVLTRPLPPTHDAQHFLAHVSYSARVEPIAWHGSPSATILAERDAAWRRLRALNRSPAAFRQLTPQLRRELVCDVLVELAQLAGRARRGGTPVELFFVDGAFTDAHAPWRTLVSDVFSAWDERGVLDEMRAFHGAFLDGLQRYASYVSRSNG